MVVVSGATVQLDIVTWKINGRLFIDLFIYSFLPPTDHSTQLLEGSYSASGLRLMRGPTPLLKATGRDAGPGPGGTGNRTRVLPTPRRRQPSAPSRWKRIVIYSLTLEPIWSKTMEWIMGSTYKPWLRAASEKWWPSGAAGFTLSGKTSGGNRQLAVPPHTHTHIHTHSGAGMNRKLTSKESGD